MIHNSTECLTLEPCNNAPMLKISKHTANLRGKSASIQPVKSPPKHSCIFPFPIIWNSHTIHVKKSPFFAACVFCCVSFRVQSSATTGKREKRAIWMQGWICGQDTPRKKRRKIIKEDDAEAFVEWNPSSLIDRTCCERIYWIQRVNI